ncbi:MAG TPA: hypothetical protein VK923_08975 [Euzebyales bacterium]|nr:hypothetical protein [Euzebyales bacterium]
MSRSRLLRAVSAAAVIAITVFAQVGMILAPSQLGRNPLLTLALRPTPAFLVLVADVVPALTAVLVAAVGRTMVDMAYFVAVRHGAAPLLRRFGIGKELTGGLSRTTASRGLLAITFVWSSSPIIAALGLGSTPAWLFLAVTGAGNVVTSTATSFRGGGWERSSPPSMRGCRRTGCG